MKRSFVWFIAASLATWGASSAIGCGNTVDDTQAGATGGGGGGKTTATATTSTASGRGGSQGTGASSSRASSTKASTGAGGAGGEAEGSGGAASLACSKACDKAAGCGLDICQLAGVDCTMPSALADCAAPCIEQATCDELANATTNPPPDLAVCLVLGCNILGTMGPIVDCGSCGAQSCTSELEACYSDPDCQTWLQCIGNCDGTDSSCSAACNAASPNGAALYDGVYACTCTSCSTECGYISPCENGDASGGSGGGGASGSGTGGATGAGGSAGAGASGGAH